MKPLVRHVSRRPALVAAIAFGAALSTAPALAAVNVYLLVDGIDGPSTSRPHAIDLLSFSEGVARVVASGPSGAGRAAAKVTCSDLSVMKQLDAASISLVQAAFTGQTFKSATLVYSKPVLDKQQDYFSITLSNVIVTSVQQAGSNENPTESVSLTASSFTFSYTPQKSDGSLGDPATFSGSCQ